jgi:hypothetical protein
MQSVVALKAVVTDGDVPLELRHEAQSSLFENLEELNRRAEFDGQARAFVHSETVTSLTREGELS